MLSESKHSDLVTGAHDAGAVDGAVAENAVLYLKEISKSFGQLLAVDNVPLQVNRNEIHALLGENGAGKSTLVKLIYGLLRPDNGIMRLGAEAYRPGNPAAARSAGIGMVFQHFSLFDALTVEENIAVVLDNTDTAKLAKTIDKLSESYGLKLDPKARVSQLSAGERQRVEIVRCLLQNPRIVILDEPTSVLTPLEAEQLFETLRQLADSGCSIIYISHKLEEVRALCQRATVMRRGKVVANCDPREIDTSELAELMVGKIKRAPPAKKLVQPRAYLSVENLSIKAENRSGVSLQNISFSLHAGEILGIAGIAGNGQRELLSALTGEVTSPSSSAIRLDDQPVGSLKPDARRAIGMCFVSEERLDHAAVSDMDLIGNATLTARVRKQLEKFGFMNWSKAQAYTESVIDAFEVRTAGPRDAAANLSGGNLQKYILGREILQSPTVLVVSQPTWGVDAGARAAIHDAFLKLAAKDCCILIISQDLDELFELSDRIAAIASGRLSPTYPTSELDAAAIGRMMTGLT